MRTMTLSCAILGLALAAASALARDFYVAGDAGPLKATDVCESQGLAGVAGCRDTAAAWRIAAGLEFTPNWGAELSYADYGSANIGVATAPTVFRGLVVPAGGSLGQWSATGYELAGIGTLPLARGFAAFAKLGAASTRINLTGPGAHSTTTTLAWGLGAKYHVTGTFDIRAQYERLGVAGNYATTGKTGEALISAGVVFKL